MSEVKNEGLEVVAWQFFEDGKWYLGSDRHDHKSNTIAAGYPVRELCAHSEALAAIAVRDARIVELDKENQHSRSVAISRGLELADIRPAMRLLEDERDQLRAEVAAIKAQEPVAFVHFRDGEIDYDNAYVISNEPGDCIDDSYEWRPLYAAPVAKQVVMPHLRLQFGLGNALADAECKGWNAYAAEYKRLNAADQEGGQDE